MSIFSSENINDNPNGDLEDFDDLEDLDGHWSEDELERTSFVCEDCDYRWDEATPEEIESGMLVCPMCGSINVTQL